MLYRPDICKRHFKVNPIQNRLQTHTHTHTKRLFFFVLLMSWTWTRNCINAFQLFDAVSLTDRSDLKPSVTFMRRTKVVREPLCQFKYINAISYTLITSRMKENCPLRCHISFTLKQTGFDKKINTWLNTVQSKCLIVSFGALADQPWVSKSFFNFKRLKKYSTGPVYSTSFL